MYYKIKNVTVKKDGLYITAAPSNLHPITFVSEKYEPRNGVAPLHAFMTELVTGNCQPTPGCKYKGLPLTGIVRDIHTLRRVAAPTPSYWDDVLYEENFNFKLEDLLATIAETWAERGIGGIRKADVESVRALDAECRNAYENKRKEMAEKGILFVHAATRSNLFPGYDALITGDERMFLGKRSRYNNKGRYDNADDSAIFLAGPDKEAAAVLFHFFGDGYLPKQGSEPDVDWDLLLDIPGSAAAELLYEELRKEKTA